MTLLFPTCRECGCTDIQACVTDAGACYWVEPDLCSACAASDTPGEELCSDCPPIGYPTDKTRCAPCPRTAGPSGHAGLVAVAELIRTCPDCHGTGLVDEVQSSLFAGQPPPNKIPCACCEAIAALSRATEAVTVKPLEWEATGIGTHYAVCAVGEYCATDGGAWWLDNSAAEHCDGLEAAKAAAQADYETRILSALGTPPAPQPALALIEELEGVLRRTVDYIEPTCPLGRSIDTVLASAKRFKGE